MNETVTNETVTKAIDLLAVEKEVRELVKHCNEAQKAGATANLENISVRFLRLYDQVGYDRLFEAAATTCTLIANMGDTQRATGIAHGSLFVPTCNQTKLNNEPRFRAAYQCMCDVAQACIENGDLSNALYLLKNMRISRITDYADLREPPARLAVALAEKSLAAGDYETVHDAVQTVGALCQTHSTPFAQRCIHVLVAASEGALRSDTAWKISKAIKCAALATDIAVEAKQTQARNVPHVKKEAAITGTLENIFVEAVKGSDKDVANKSMDLAFALNADKPKEKARLVTEMLNWANYMRDANNSSTALRFLSCAIDRTEGNASQRREIRGIADSVSLAARARVDNTSHALPIMFEAAKTGIRAITGLSPAEQPPLRESYAQTLLDYAQHANANSLPTLAHSMAKEVMEISERPALHSLAVDSCLAAASLLMQNLNGNYNDAINVLTTSMDHAVQIEQRQRGAYLLFQIAGDACQRKAMIRVKCALAPVERCDLGDKYKQYAKRLKDYSTGVGVKPGSQDPVTEDWVNAHKENEDKNASKGIDAALAEFLAGFEPAPSKPLKKSQRAQPTTPPQAKQG